MIVQGMEDCLIFDELMDQYGDINMEKVLPAFTDYRCVDAHAVVDLAMYNYIEVGYLCHIDQISMINVIETDAGFGEPLDVCFAEEVR